MRPFARVLVAALPLMAATAAGAQPESYRVAVLSSATAGSTGDPLQALRGKKIFKPSRVLPGIYRCRGVGGAYKGALPVPRLGAFFTILDGSRYRDAFRVYGTYTFSMELGTIVFRGGARDGHRAAYEQRSEKPTRKQPPTVTFAASGDTCELRM